MLPQSKTEECAKRLGSALAWDLRREWLDSTPRHLIRSSRFGRGLRLCRNYQACFRTGAGDATMSSGVPRLRSGPDDVTPIVNGPQVITNG